MQAHARAFPPSGTVRPDGLRLRTSRGLRYVRSTLMRARRRHAVHPERLRSKREPARGCAPDDRERTVDIARIVGHHNRDVRHSPRVPRPAVKIAPMIVESTNVHCRRSLPRNPWSVVVIDLRQCTFVDSTIIGAILTAGRGDSRRVANVSVVMPDDTSYVYRALSIIGLRDLVPAHVSIEAALGALHVAV